MTQPNPVPAPTARPQRTEQPPPTVAAMQAAAGALHFERFGTTDPEAARAAARWYAEAAAEVAHIEDDAAREEQQDRAITRCAHAAGDHQWCDVTCEVAMPSEAMRNFIVAKGYPGTAGALAELERRAAAQAQVPAVLSEAERTTLTYALDQAQERIWADAGFTEQDQAAVDSLRRLTIPAGGEQA
ncbi:hypothetical protein [Streptomyces sp. NRRL F-5123]|uniref:hypothetical protein n=1 Tax=Streptomyces sp. NRRL F-5123 TaxID=1463856 RepID=UPI0006937025|nr:hypothetical protein [Streptomyces sp. NRRL F-5123]